MNISRLAAYARQGIEALGRDDPLLYELLDHEYDRQVHTLNMVAASSLADPSVLACDGTVASNVVTEGYPGARFHAGCSIVDEIERLAIARAKRAFHARYANVQPHSGTSANQIVLFSMLKPGDTLLGLELNAGGHLSHGAKVSVSGKYFHAIGYGLTSEGLLDYEQIDYLADRWKPRLIICGASAYPRSIDFKRFREIADKVGALLLADISHIAGLVVAGVHQNPIDFAHFTTTSTYKQLYGPRGGLILMGKDYESLTGDGRTQLAQTMQQAVFPFFQGTPSMNTIAAKARALALVTAPSFTTLAHLIVADAQALARHLLDQGYAVLTGGTDTHLVVVDVSARGLTGLIAERALEECSIIVNKNKIPGDRHPARITSGIRLGTNTLALRGMGGHEMLHCTRLIHQVLSAVTVYNEKQYVLDEKVRDAVCVAVQDLCERFPVPHYPEAALSVRNTLLAKIALADS